MRLLERGDRLIGPTPLRQDFGLLVQGAVAELGAHPCEMPFGGVAVAKPMLDNRQPGVAE